MGHFSFRYRTREGQLKSFLVFTVLWNQVGWQCRAEFYDGARSAVASCEKNRGGKVGLLVMELYFFLSLSLVFVMGDSGQWNQGKRRNGNNCRNGRGSWRTEWNVQTSEWTKRVSWVGQSTRVLCWTLGLCLKYCLSLCLCSKAWKLIRVEAAWRESLLEWCVKNWGGGDLVSDKSWSWR